MKKLKTILTVCIVQFKKKIDFYSVFQIYKHHVFIQHGIDQTETGKERVCGDQ